MAIDDNPGLREVLKELAEVSRDLDRHQKMSQTASHPIQAQQVRKRIDELTEQQSTLMEGLVARHPDDAKKAKFEALGQELDKLRADIKACNDPAELEKYEAEIEATVDRWVHQFQIIVAEITGVEPPAKPMY